MLRRFLHSAATFAAIVVAYQAYVLLAVPWLNPPLTARAGGSAGPADYALAKQAITRYQELLAAYFPAGHWSLGPPPQVLESGQVMLVVGDYDIHDDGRP